MKQVFYTPATAANPHPRSIDMVFLAEDGSRRGMYSNKTENELTVEYGEVRVMGLKDFSEMQDATYVTDPVEITESEFHNALDALPPLIWRRVNGIESFRLSEFYSGQITTIYAKTADGRFWKFMDDVHISFDDLNAKIVNAASA